MNEFSKKLSKYRKLSLSNGIFQAKIVPGIGGNVISLRHLASGTKLLREPANLQELAKFPEQFGLPVLFPPNRIDGGKFTFEGRNCLLPVNEIAMNNHLHGLAVGKAWDVVSANKNSVELKYVFSQECPEYEGFPFAFTLKRNLILTSYGLTDQMTVINDGQWNMPLGLGYHSTFPAKSAKVRLSVGVDQFEIGERFLPTGRHLPWSEIDPRNWFNPDGINAGFHTLAAKIILDDGTVLHGAQIRYETGLLQYLTDEKFGFWYTWNKMGKGDFISLEPVSWMANALNLSVSGEETGVQVLVPGSKSVFCCELRFSAENSASS